MQRTKSLLNRGHVLSNLNRQVEMLEKRDLEEKSLPAFSEKIQSIGLHPLQPTGVEIFQVNVGYLCNQVCRHCHVDAGPDRREIMTKDTMKQCIDILNRDKIRTLDITGGAPEMNPDFRWFVAGARHTQVEEVIVRSNLTIIRSNPKFYDLPAFFREHRVRICSSLPFYQPGKTDRQRGEGVFQKSIEALRALNEAGYGVEGTGLILDLIYNPAGAFLPGDQNELQRIFKKELKNQYGIGFNHLFTITNVPVNRFLEFLLETDNYEEYMEKLVTSFNPAAVEGVMCRNTISVNWEGYMYDCDFNQMLGLKLNCKSTHISQFDLQKLAKRKIATGQHCFACTAGAGSSCQGATI